jgi:exodeoxyribonuclease VII large subunit
LAVLGPQATLDRGYAIVRRSDDGAIVREPLEAPAGTSLRLRIARGEIAAISAGELGPTGAAEDAAAEDASADDAAATQQRCDA